MRGGSDPREILGVEAGADVAEVKARYRELALRYHPDTNGGDRTAEWVFKAIVEAYEELIPRGGTGVARRADKASGPGAGHAASAHQAANEERGSVGAARVVGGFCGGALAWPMALYVMLDAVAPGMGYIPAGEGIREIHPLVMISGMVFSGFLSASVARQFLR